MLIMTLGCPRHCSELSNTSLSFTYCSTGHHSACGSTVPNITVLSLNQHCHCPEQSSVWISAVQNCTLLDSALSQIQSIIFLSVIILTFFHSGMKILQIINIFRQFANMLKECTLLKLDFFPFLSPNQSLHRLRTCWTNICEKQCLFIDTNWFVLLLKYHFSVSYHKLFWFHILDALILPQYNAENVCSWCQVADSLCLC